MELAGSEGREALAVGYSDMLAGSFFITDCLVLMGASYPLTIHLPDLAVNCVPRHVLRSL